MGISAAVSGDPSPEERKLQESSDTSGASAESSGPESGKEGGSSKVEGSFGSDLRQFASDIADAGGRFGSQIGKRAASTYEGAKTAVRSAAESVSTNAKSASEAARQAVIAGAQRALSWMAADPDVEQSTVDRISKMAPGLGSTKMYADAWARYHRGKESANEEMVNEARRECITACISVGMDLSTLGLSALVRSNRAIQWMLPKTFLGKAAGRLGQFAMVNIPWAERALKSERVQKFADSLLESVQPLKVQEEVAEMEPANEDPGDSAEKV